MTSLIELFVKDMMRKVKVNNNKKYKKKNIEQAMTGTVLFVKNTLEQYLDMQTKHAYFKFSLLVKHC